MPQTTSYRNYNNAVSNNREQQTAYELRYERNRYQAAAMLLDICIRADNRDRELQRVAVESLRIIDAGQAFTSLLKLTGDFDPMVRSRGLYLLVHLGDRAGVDATMRGLGDSDVRVVKAAIFCLGHLGRDRRTITALERIMTGNEPDFLQTAARRSLLFVLLGIAYDESRDFPLHKEAIRLLATHFSREALAAFGKSAMNQDPARRSRAYLNIGILNVPGGLRPVLTGLTDRDDEARRMAIIAAGKLGRDHKTVAALQPLINDYEPTNIQAAAKFAITRIRQRMNGDNGRREYRPSMGAPRNVPRPEGNDVYTRRAF